MDRGGNRDDRHGHTMLWNTSVQDRRGNPPDVVKATRFAVKSPGEE